MVSLRGQIHYESRFVVGTSEDDGIVDEEDTRLAVTLSSASGGGYWLTFLTTKE